MPKRKYTYNSVKRFVESIDYVLLTPEKEYVNVGSRLRVRCSNGHVYNTYWSNLYGKGYRCKQCCNRGLEYIKREMALENYMLLTDCYKNQLSKLRYSCPEGHINSTTWNNWRNGSRCPDCVKTPYRTVVNAFRKEGYTILSKESEYNGCKFKFVYKCSMGHVESMHWYNFKYGCRCPKCSVGNVSKISQKWLDSLGVKIREYKIPELNIRVDGYDPETNTIYEFFGDYWHGNPNVYNKMDMNYHNKKTFGELYKESMKRLADLENVGYTVCYTWEEDFIKLCKF